MCQWWGSWCVRVADGGSRCLQPSFLQNLQCRRVPELHSGPRRHLCVSSAAAHRFNNPERDFTGIIHHCQVIGCQWGEAVAVCAGTSWRRYLRRSRCCWRSTWGSALTTGTTAPAAARTERRCSGIRCCSTCRRAAAAGRSCTACSCRDWREHTQLPDQNSLKHSSCSENCLCLCRRYVRTPDPSEELEEEVEEEEDEEEELYKSQTNGISDGKILVLIREDAES